MKLNKAIVSLSFCFFVCVSFSQNIEDLKTINNQIWTPFSTAFQTLDSELFASLHNSDFIRISGNSKKIKSKTEYTNGYKTRWKDSSIKQTIAFRFLERISNGKTASERGIYKLTINPGTKNEKAYYGKFHVVLIKVEMQWQILIDYDSTENNTINQESYASSFAIDDYNKY